MEDALTFALSAPLITMVVAIIRRLAPAVDGDWVPRLVLVVTLAWGVVLVLDGRFTGGLAEFIIAVAAVSAAAIGINRLDKVTHRDTVALSVDGVVDETDPPPA